MSCVTKQSLNKDIKNIILTEDWSSLDIKSTLSTKNSTSTTYSDRVEVFIPFDSVNPSKNTLYGKLKNLESQLNKTYQSDIYGNTVQTQMKPNGGVIFIHSPLKLVEALNQQYNSQENTSTDIEGFKDYENKKNEYFDIRNKYFQEGDTQKSSTILKKISESNNPLSVLAKNLLNYVEINDVEIILEPLSKLKTDGIESLGYYYSKENHIKIAEFIETKEYSSIERLLLHEILHALSYKSLRIKNEFNEKFTNLFNRSKDILGNYDSENNIGIYANYSIDEFFVALFTDAKFIKLLNDIPSSNNKFKNFLEEVLDVLLSFLKIEKKETLYTESFALATEILKNTLVDYEYFNSIEDTSNYLFQISSDLPLSPREEEVKYSFKATENILKNLSKVNQWYKQLGDTNTFWNKLQQDLQIPKEQVNLLRESFNNIKEADVILPIGTSGSGKSTFIKSLPQENLVAIEPDAMRVEFTGDMNDKSKDKEIYEEASKRAVKAIKQGKQVVFDTTNLTKDKRLPFIEAIKKEIPNVNIQYKLMELNPELAKQRIKAQIERGENRANVPDSTIDRHAESYKQMLEDIKNEPISNFESSKIEKALLDFIANYSYTVEINTAKTEEVERSEFLSDEDMISLGKGTGNLINTKYYSNLTVPGGTNYAENEIATPAIIPSIQGHAQFASNSGIGWFRSDEQMSQDRITKSHVKAAKLQGIELQEQDFVGSKTRRILEVQSDLFQKGKDREDLVGNKDVGSDGDSFYGTDGIYSNNFDGTFSREDKNGNINIIDKAAYEKEKNIRFSNSNENQFLQLLNKDNNWVTFFIKSIIQDSAKKGYEKVLFPSGNTASRIEGHTTLEEFKREKENRIKELEKDNSNLKVEKKDSKYYIIEPFIKEVDSIEEGNNQLKKYVEKNNNEINQLKQELERIETEGFGALKPIYNFYENTVTNILNKTYGKENVKQVIDEYGNTWNEITLQKKQAQEAILLSRHNVATINDVMESQKIVLTTRDNEKQTKPLGDNLIELIEWKKSKLKIYEEKIAKLKLILKYDSKNKKVVQELSNLLSIQNRISSQIDNLNELGEEYLYKFIYEDIDEILNSFDNLLHNNINDIKIKIDWYGEFIKTLDIKFSEESKKLAGKLGVLLFEYNKLLKEKTLNILENDSLIQKTLSNLNLDDSAKEKLNISENELIEIEHLLMANKDISKADFFYGQITSWTGTTVIPEFLLNQTMKTINKHENNVFDIIDRLDNFNLKYKATKIDRNTLIKKDHKGNKTGYLISVYTDKWNKNLEYSRNLIRDLIKAGSKDKKTIFKKLFEWHKENTEVINFFKLKIIKDLYENVDDYSKYFIYSDKEMDDYEIYLKDLAGYDYNNLINSLVLNLKNYQEYKITKVDDKYYNSNLAKKDHWQFLYNYNKNIIKSNKQSNSSFTSYYSVGFYDLVFVPKKEITSQDFTLNEKGQLIYKNITKDSEYYDEDFRLIKDNPVLFELWSLYKEMSDYINHTYNNFGTEKITYPKIEKDLSERILINLASVKKGNFGKLGTIFMDSIDEFRKLFTNSNNINIKDQDVKSNNIDTSNKKYKDLINSYLLKGYDYEEAVEKANEILTPTYSEDLDRNFKASLILAAVHNARLELEPTSKMIFNYYKTIKSKDGEERKNAITKLEYFLNKTILNQNDKTAKDNTTNENVLSKILDYLRDNTRFGKNFINKYGFKLLSEQEKLIFKEFQKLKNEPFKSKTGIYDSINGREYFFKIEEVISLTTDNKKTFYIKNNIGSIIETDIDTFNQEYESYIHDKINSFGLTTNLASFIEGILKTLIIKSLGFNLVGGLFNRLEGKHTIMVMDLTGTYWTPGNSDVANEILAYLNLNKYSKKYLNKELTKNAGQINIFKYFIERLGGLQDRKNELEKNDKSFLKFDIYEWAVTSPEFHNQGQIALSILMDETVYDDNGIGYKIFDKDKKEFSLFEIKDDIITIKSNFKKSFKFNSDQIQNLMVKISNAISHSQGNYNVNDVTVIKNNIWGKALMLFKSWLPEALYNRFGIPEDSEKGEINVNLAFGKRKTKGRYIKSYEASKLSTFAFATGAFGVSYGLLGGVGLIGGGALSAYIYKQFLSKISNKTNIENDGKSIIKLAEFIKSVLIESLNYPSRLFSSVPIVNKIKYNKGINDTFSNLSFIKYTNKEGDTISEKEYNKLSENEKLNYNKNNTSLSDEEIGSLKSMSRELAIMLMLLLMKLSVSLLMYSDDDDEDSRAKKRYNFAQNQFDRLIESLNIYLQPQALYTDSSRIGAISYLENLQNIVKYTVFEWDSEKRINSLTGILPIPRDIVNAMKLQLPIESKYKKSDYIDNLIEYVNKDEEELYKEKWLELRKNETETIKKHFLNTTDNKEAIKSITQNILKSKYGIKGKNKTYKETFDNINLKNNLNNDLLEDKLIKKLEKLGFDKNEIDEIMIENYNYIMEGD